MKFTVVAPPPWAGTGLGTGHMFTINVGSLPLGMWEYNTQHTQEGLGMGQIMGSMGNGMAHGTTNNIGHTLWGHGQWDHTGVGVGGVVGNIHTVYTYTPPPPHTCVWGRWGFMLRRFHNHISGI